MNRPGLPPFADDVHTPLLLHDPETGAIRDANTAAADLYGYSVQELCTLDVEEFSSEAPEFSQTEAERRIAAAAEGEERSFEWQIKRKSGGLAWVRVELRPITLEGERFVLAEQQDITEFRTRTRRLQLLYRIIRHNLRNQMTVAQGYAEDLARMLDDDDHRARAERIVDVAGDVGGMADSVARIEAIATGDDEGRAPVDVHGLLADLAREFEADYPGVTVTVSGDEEPRVSADRELRFALENAIENAIEHSESAAPTVEVSVTAVPVERLVRIRIADQCPPIPAMELEALDELHETTDVNHGTGVGLFVMKWCAQSLGGDLDVEVGADGNVVEFTFPLYEGPSTSGDGVAV